MQHFLRGLKNIFQRSQLFVFVAIVFFSMEAFGQDNVTKRDSVKHKADTLTFVTGDTTSKQEKRHKLPDYFNKTFTLSKSANNVFVSVKKNKYALTPDATVGDLLEKIPSVYNLDGSYYVQGKELTSMLMNLYTFFEKNYNAITVFPASSVGSVHIYEDPSFSMLWSGVLDNNSANAVDVITDVSYAQNSWSGRFYGGWGITDMWDAGASTSYFDGDRKANFMVQSNNINKMCYTPLDLSGMLASSNLNNFDFRDPDPQINYKNIADQVNFRDIDQSNGINRDVSTGVRYFDVYKNMKYYLNYYYNNTDNNTKTDFERFYNDSDNNNLQYSEQTSQHSINSAHRINGRFYYYLKNQGLFRITPTVYVQKLTGEMALSGNYQTQETAVNTANNNDFDGSYTNFDVDFGYSFKKPGRSLLLNAIPRYNTRKNLYNIQTLFQTSDSLFEQSNISVDGFSINASASYVEPIGKRGLMQFTYLYGWENDHFNKLSNYSDTTIFSPHLLDSCSMLNYNTDNIFQSHTFSVVYQYNATQWRLNFGLKMAYNSVEQNILNKDADRQENPKFYPMPVFNFVYSFDDFSMLKIALQSHATAPSVLNLQETFLMQNPLNATYGNADLKYSMDYVFDLRFTHLNRKNSSYMFFHLGATYSNNYIGNDMISDFDNFYNYDVIQSYVAVVKPVNLDNYISATPYFHYTFPLPRMKSTLDVDIFGKYSHIPTVSDDENGFSNQLRAGGGLALKSGIDERIDFTLSTYSTYNYNVATWNPDQSDQYVYQRIKLNINALPFKRRLLLQTDVAHNFTWGSYSAYDEINREAFFLWNASIGFKFLKNRSLTLKGSVHDILNQNKNIYHYVTSIYTEQLKTNNLKRYFMISLTYNLNKLGKSNSNVPTSIMP